MVGPDPMPRSAYMKREQNRVSLLIYEKIYLQHVKIVQSMMEESNSLQNETSDIDDTLLVYNKQ